jgi:hypothetical protein
VPQVPQLAGSVWVFTHLPLQLVKVPVQLVLHVAEEQACPDGQAVPQAPQFWVSV